MSRTAAATSRWEDQRSFDELGRPLRDLTFCVVDLETTGGSAEGGSMITEIGAVKVRGGEELGVLGTLVNPGERIPPFITVLTGITEAMLAPAPPIEAVLPSLLEFLRGAVLVAHNAPYDVGFLKAACARHGHPWPQLRVLDTAALARRALPRDEVPNRKLGTLAQFVHAAVQPGGSLFGLQEANPINEDAAFGGNASDYGTTKDYMVGKRIGGTNVFGGGFALYNTSGDIVGGVGVSGDTSCADHVIGWKVRHALNLDDVPAGVAPGNNDNIIYDFSGGQSAGGFGQPHCINASAETSIAASLPTQYPTGPTP